MATPPTFSVGQYNTAAYMNSIGLWLVKSQTIGTSVSTVTVTNCFSSDYDNYRVTIEGTVGSVNDNAISLQFANVANHYASMAYWSYTGAGNGSLATNAQTFAYVGLSGTAGQQTLTMDILAPNLARFTKFTGNLTSNLFMGTSGGVYASSTQFTGFTLIFPGTTTGGTIRVYGYRN